MFRRGGGSAIRKRTPGRRARGGGAGAAGAARRSPHLAAVHVRVHVVIIGAGRLGRSLGILLPQASIGVTVVERGGAIPAADVYWLAVRDAQLADAVALLPRDRVVLHAAGALGAEVLGHPLGGVLHPMMTFPGPSIGVPDLRGAGARVDGHPRARAAARDIAERLGMAVVEDVDPVAWHAAASMVSGHMAALLLDAADVLDRGRTGRTPPASSLLLPLALESLRRASAAGDAAITGPAARGDDATVALHVQRLGAEAPAYRALDARIRARRRG